jgi:hypothetical protein
MRRRSRTGVSWSSARGPSDPIAAARSSSISGSSSAGAVSRTTSSTSPSVISWPALRTVGSVIRSPSTSVAWVGGERDDLDVPVRLPDRRVQRSHVRIAQGDDAPRARSDRHAGVVDLGGAPPLETRGHMHPHRGALCALAAGFSKR